MLRCAIDQVGPETVRTVVAGEVPENSAEVEPVITRRGELEAAGREPRRASRVGQDVAQQISSARIPHHEIENTRAGRGECFRYGNDFLPGLPMCDELVRIDAGLDHFPRHGVPDRKRGRSKFRSPVDAIHHEAEPRRCGGWEGLRSQEIDATPGALEVRAGIFVERAGTRAGGHRRDRLVIFGIQDDQLHRAFPRLQEHGVLTAGVRREGVRADGIAGNRVFDHDADRNPLTFSSRLERGITGDGRRECYSGGANHPTKREGRLRGAHHVFRTGARLVHTHNTN